mgnify:CR=1 FL=1
MKNNDLKPYGTYLNMLAHKYDKGQVFEDFFTDYSLLFADGESRRTLF